MGPFCVVCGKPLRCGAYPGCKATATCDTCMHNPEAHTICKCEYRDYEIHISRLNDEILELEHRVSCDETKIKLYQRRWDLYMATFNKTNEDKHNVY